MILPGELCRCAVKTLTVYFEVLTGEDLVPGVLAAIQIFGDRINFHPHLHLLVTTGGVDGAETFHRVSRLDDLRLAEIFAKEVLRSSAKAERKTRNRPIQKGRFRVRAEGGLAVRVQWKRTTTAYNLNGPFCLIVFLISAISFGHSAKGEVAFPVAEITISGNLSDVLRGVEMVGDDLELNATIAGPTVKVAQMFVFL